MPDICPLAGPSSEQTDAGAGAFEPCGRRYEPAYRWLCVHTGFNREKTARDELVTLGLPTWWPRFQDPKGRIQTLFPGYLFSQADMSDDLWRSIYFTRGVIGVLGTGFERPTRVRVGVVEALWNQCAADGVIYPTVAAPVPVVVILPGMAVALVSGPLASLAIVSGICRWSVAKRVALLLRTLDGREMRVTVPRSDVVALVPVH